MDSLATLAIPAMGYGIRYEYGMFRQKLKMVNRLNVRMIGWKKGAPLGIYASIKTFQY